MADKVAKLPSLVNNLITNQGVTLSTRSGYDRAINFSEESNIEYRTRNNECRRIIEHLILKNAEEILPSDCRAGLRAAQAYRILKNAGFSNVKYMDGSILAWTYGLEK